MKKTGPVQNEAQHASAIQTMFDAIAPRYDFLNRFLSLRRDVYWRKRMITAVMRPGAPVRTLLDVACGTGDVAIEAIRQGSSELSVWGADFSHAMLAAGKNKVAPFKDRIHLVAADAFFLPFRDSSFDAVTIAFGIRNIVDKPAVLEGFYRHLKQGGVLAVLELTTPQKGFLKSLYLFYFKRILPLIGWVVSKNMGAYQYLPASVMGFPPSPEFARMMEHAGFADVSWHPLTFGIATLYVGYKK